MSLLATQPVYADGIHLPGTPIWLDPVRPQAISFVSHPGRVAPLYYRKSLASTETANLVRALSSGDRKFHPLTPPYGQGFTLGNIRAELLPSGVGFGVSQLRLETEGYVTLYSRDISLQGNDFGSGATHCPANRLILGTDGALPQLECSSHDQREAQLLSELKGLTEAGHGVLLRVSGFGVAQEVSRLLGTYEIPHRVGPAIQAIQKTLNDMNIPCAMQATTSHIRRGEVLLWSSSSSREPLGDATCCRDLDAGPGGTWREHGGGKSLNWTSLASQEELLTFVERITPDEIITVGEQKGPMARFLKTKGWNAAALVTTPQLPLQI